MIALALYLTPSVVLFLACAHGALLGVDRGEYDPPRFARFPDLHADTMAQPKGSSTRNPSQNIRSTRP